MNAAQEALEGIRRELDEMRSYSDEDIQRMREGLSDVNPWKCRAESVRTFREKEEERMRYIREHSGNEEVAVLAYEYFSRVDVSVIDGGLAVRRLNPLQAIDKAREDIFYDFLSGN